MDAVFAAECEEVSCRQSFLIWTWCFCNNIFGGDAAPHFKTAVIISACKQCGVKRACGRTGGYLIVDSKFTDSGPKANLV